MRNIMFMALMVAGPCVGSLALADELRYSAKSEISDNPFLAYGYNPKTKVISGYLAAFRTTPGRTDECKVVFKGNADRLSVKYHEETWALPGQNGQDVTSISVENNGAYLIFNKETMGGDCDWILPFKAGKRVRETADKVVMSMKVSQSGDWIGVYVIGAKKAKFYREPDLKSAKSAYLVAGNVVYVYEEQADWYFVEYNNEKGKTTGWVKKVDTVQP